MEPGWGAISGGPICTGPPAHLCLTQRWMTCPTWVLLSRPVGRLRTLLTGAALQSASQVVSLLRKGAEEPRCGHTGSSGLWFLSLCSNASYLKRLFTSSENELTGEESKGGGWRSLNLQHIVRVSGCHGLSPPSRQVWQSEGLQEQREALRPPRCLHTDHLPDFLFLLRDLAFPALHAGGLFSVEALKNQPLRKKRELFLLILGFVCVCVRVCACTSLCVCVFTQWNSIFVKFLYGYVAKFTSILFWFQNQPWASLF